MKIIQVWIDDVKKLFVAAWMREMMFSSRGVWLAAEHRTVVTGGEFVLH